MDQKSENAVNPPADLSDLLKTDEQSMDKVTEMLTMAMENIEGSLASIHLGLRSLNTRVATLENFVAYLLSKDPEAGPQIKAMADASKDTQHEPQAVPVVP